METSKHEDRTLMRCKYHPMQYFLEEKQNLKQDETLKQRQLVPMTLSMKIKVPPKVVRAIQIFESN